MPERRRRLRETLAELRAELESTREVNAELREELRSAVRGIEARLERDEDDEPEAFSDRLRELALRFEGSHPRLAETVNRIVHGLAELGI